MELFERCKAARQRAKLSQEQLALDIGVSRGAVSQWELSGGTAPTVTNLGHFAVRCGVQFEWLATGRGDMVYGEPTKVLEDRAAYPIRHPSDAELLELLAAWPPKKRAALLEVLKR